MQLTTALAGGHGLTLLGVESVVWRTPDTPENRLAFSSTKNLYGHTRFPQVRMVCQMELTSQRPYLTGNFIHWDCAMTGSKQANRDVGCYRPKKIYVLNVLKSFSKNDCLIKLTTSAASNVPVYQKACMPEW